MTETCTPVKYRAVVELKGPAESDNLVWAMNVRKWNRVVQPNEPRFVFERMLAGSIEELNKLFEEDRAKVAWSLQHTDDRQQDCAGLGMSSEDFGMLRVQCDGEASWLYEGQLTSEVTM